MSLPQAQENLLLKSHSTLMQALLDFTLSSGQQWAAAVVFAYRFSDGGVPFPVQHAEVASVLWWVAFKKNTPLRATFWGSTLWKLTNHSVTV